ncbi:hypothetical protein E4T56_gene20667 [Termitomyces sp. T112]|nr:hypothetical protein E4T56_gene20667 [Termitomyces sp. T112]
MSPIFLPMIIGPMLAGHLLNYALMGILTFQVYIYRLSYRKDKMVIKLLVYSTWMLDLVQTLFASHYAWFFFVSNWGDMTVIFKTTWSLLTIPLLTSITALIVQLFSLWRIWILGEGRKVYLALIIIIFLEALGSCTAAFFCGLNIWIRGQDPTVIFHGSWRVPVAIWFVGGALCDISIMATLVILLHTNKRSNASELNDTLHRAIAVIVEIPALLMIIIIIGKLYSNSLLAMMNARATVSYTRLSWDSSQDYTMEQQTEP